MAALLLLALPSLADVDYSDIDPSDPYYPPPKWLEEALATQPENITASPKRHPRCGPEDDFNECTAIIALWEATGKKLRDWEPDTNTSYCSWGHQEKVDGVLGWTSYITCNVLGKVLYLRPIMNGVSGTIPTEIGHLKSLTNFDFYGNHLSGTIPTEMGQLTQLENFDVYNNRLSGTIPASLCSQLKYGNCETSCVPLDCPTCEYCLSCTCSITDSNGSAVDAGCDKLCSCKPPRRDCQIRKVIDPAKGYILDPPG